MVLELIRMGVVVDDSTVLCAIQQDSASLCNVLLRGMIRHNYCTRERLLHFVETATSSEKIAACEQLRKLMPAFTECTE